MKDTAKRRIKSGGTRRSPAARLSPRPRAKRTRRDRHSDGQASTSTDHLSIYFRALGQHGLLDPDEERALAQDLEDRELLTWELLLSNPSCTDYVLGLLEARLDNSLTEFRNVRRAAAAARKARSKSSRERLHAAARKTAAQVRALDHDRQHVAAVVAELERLRAAANVNLPRIGQAKLSFSPSSRAFASYLEDALNTYRDAARMRDEFVRANLRLVVTMARRYDRGVMPLSDLIQEGNLGLMHAVSRFDYRRGLRFSTYACWWIRHAIGRAIADKARSVRVPVHMIEAQQQLAKVKAKLVTELGRQPSRVEIAEAADLPLAKLNQMSRYLLGTPVSLDQPVHTGEDARNLGDILPDPASENWKPEEELTTRALSSRVTKLMDKLSPIEADVLRKRFGLEDDEERTFREIGDQYQLSRERIRQIQNAALDKLRRALDRGR